MWWPSSSDPYYLANPVDNTARQSYYGVTGTPTMKCDGSTCGTTQSAITAAINGRLAVPSNIRMDIEAEVVNSTLNVTCHAVTDINISGSVVLHIVLLERYKYLPASPNQQPHHYAAMLKMAPYASGQVFSATAFEPVQYNASFQLDPAWDLDNLDIACFVQNNSNREVLQAVKIAVPLDYPNILMTDYEVDDPTGNGDGRVDPGETGEMVVTLENQVPFHDATDVTASLSTEDPLIDVTVSQVDFPDLPAGVSASNTSQPFEFYVDPEFEAHEVTFTLSITAEPGSWQESYPITFMVGRPEILLVNDDLAGMHQSWYEESLDEINVVYDAWAQVTMGSLPQDEMDLYLILIWYTGDDEVSTISPDEQARFESFMDGGGRIFLSSQNAGDVLGGTSFYLDVLHAEHLENATGEFLINGVAGDPVSDNTTLFIGGSGGAGNASSSSSMNPLTPAVSIYTYDQAGTTAGLRLQTEISRLVYLAFAFEAVSPSGGFTPRSEVLQNSLEWLSQPVGVHPQAPGTTLPTTLTLAEPYPNPFNPVTEFEFYLPKAGYTRLEVYDLQGKLIDSITGKTLQSGWHSFTWNASPFVSGIYVVKLENGTESRSVRAIYLK